MKLCKVCNIKLKHKERCYCKACKYVKHKLWVIENREHVRQYDRERRIKNIEKHKLQDKKKWLKIRDLESTKIKNSIRNKAWVKANPDKQRTRRLRWKKNNPLETAAHIKVKDALKYKKLIRPDICSSCCIVCKPEAHHKDYAKPLEVTWLCRPCHIKYHTKLRRNK